MRPESTEAQHRPVGRPRKEYSTEDMAVRNVPPVILPSVGDIARDDETIVVARDDILEDGLDELAFNEEPVTIVLSRSSEKFAPAIKDFYVNGKAMWIRVGVPQTVPRKYVEVIARAQPFDVRTNVVKHEEREDNMVERNLIVAHPFSVIRDDNPRGHEWLRKVMNES